MKYIFWYKTEITAKSLQGAITKERKTKAKLDGINTEEEPTVKIGTPAIGFEYYNQEELYY